MTPDEIRMLRILMDPDEPLRAVRISGSSLIVRKDGR